MRIFSLGLSLCLAMGVSMVNADPYGTPSALPYTSTPNASSYYNSYSNNYSASYAQEEVAPGVEQDSQDPPPAYAPEAYADGAGCDDGSCYGDVYGGLDAKCCGCWYGRAAALYMGRDDTHLVWLTADGTTNAQLLHNQHAEYDWQAGWELAIGYYLNPCTAIELTYWDIGEMGGSGSIWDGTDNLVSTYDAGNVTLGGVAATTYFDGAREQRVSRSSDIVNLELNFWHRPVSCCCCQSFQVNFLGGIRYFNYDNALLYGSSEGGWEFGDNGGANEAWVDVDISNNLIGFQIGADAEWNPCWCSCLSMFGRTKVGLYANHVTKDSGIYRGDGNWGVSTVGNYPRNSSDTDVAFIAELEAGVRYNVTCCWSLYASYRAMSVAGVAHSDMNVPFYFADTHGFDEINRNGDLVLHGATFGLEYNW